MGNPIILAVAAFVVILAALIVYISTIPRNKVPKTPVALPFFSIVAILLAIKAIVKSFPSTTLTIVITLIPALLTIVMAVFFLWILTQRKTPIGNIKVKVGDKLLPFTTIDSDGKPFSTKNLKKPTLLKFYRGGWCPYCSEELKMFQRMNLKINVIALSKDTPKEASIHKKRDNLTFTLLSDPKLKIIQQYGVEHHKALGGTTDGRTILGVPIAPPNSFSSMAIPTTLLINKKGIIVWIDQSEDYRIRASQERVKAAIKKL